MDLMLDFINEIVSVVINYFLRYMLALISLWLSQQSKRPIQHISLNRIRVSKRRKNKRPLRRAGTLPGNSRDFLYTGQPANPAQTF
jgi:hypothetical protein